MKNLSNKEAVEKLRDLATDIDFAILSTNLGQAKFDATPMSTKKVDDEGNIWFLSGKKSNHYNYIKEDNKVALMYSKPGNMSFMNVFGKAEIVSEQSVISELYGTGDDMWFDGENDPNICALKITPDEAEYWEPKQNKLISFFKFGIATIKGEQPDLSQHGHITV
ncbi:pyridoxamine 5'-phosphate oxidase family protein [Winogradskyella maritima]|uniref:Pyridoxamine 5'-phosphate oxidase family protein n=1 Tax=Winogradskyella maritima TaxID=1517766 RepID=A0ABV8AJL3_9FLAO|nr:pyridoxamine 5'-phosphate oxidase family protein [Winogradskyella maritima]